MFHRYNMSLTKIVNDALYTLSIKALRHSEILTFAGMGYALFSDCSDSTKIFTTGTGAFFGFWEEYGHNDKLQKRICLFFEQYYTHFLNKNKIDFKDEEEYKKYILSIPKDELFIDEEDLKDPFKLMDYSNFLHIDKNYRNKQKELPVEITEDILYNFPEARRAKIAGPILIVLWTAMCYGGYELCKYMLSK